jgi:hypothetical protein
MHQIHLRFLQCFIRVEPQLTSSCCSNFCHLIFVDVNTCTWTQPRTYPMDLCGNSGSLGRAYFHGVVYIPELILMYNYTLVIYKEYDYFFKGWASVAKKGLIGCFVQVLIKKLLGSIISQKKKNFNILLKYSTYRRDSSLVVEYSKRHLSDSGFNSEWERIFGCGLKKSSRRVSSSLRLWLMLTILWLGSHCRVGSCRRLVMGGQSPGVFSTSTYWFHDFLAFSGLCAPWVPTPVGEEGFLLPNQVF